ncbi:NUDIX domain-containing protein [Peterkaempfera griseoplana]|uniref:NUDIX domain-containing protein n=1 Tax=Peterkaempfera griseoplana TaxID=66896 RepID=UPI0006E411D4|nr:NUDIX hydrolase [Peterkaempfera griseoplana]
MDTPEPPRLLPVDQYLAGLTRAYVASGALITDASDRLLIVKPTYRTRWSLPGGTVDPGEDPAQCVVREVAEETGLTVTLVRLAAVHWTAHVDGRESGVRPTSGHPGLQFVFDCGSVPDGTEVRLPPDELEDFRWCTPEEAYRLLSPGSVRRLRAALAVRDCGRTAFISGSTPPGPHDWSADIHVH